MPYLKPVANESNVYEVAETDINNYSEISGEALVQSLCREIGGTDNPLSKRVITGQLTDEIQAFDRKKSMGNLLSIYKKLGSLSEKILGRQPSQITMPKLSITIPQVMIAAAEEEAENERIRIAEEEAENERIRIVEEEAENERIIANEELERENREHFISHLQGENRVQVGNYIKAYNYCIKQETLTAEAFTICFNGGLFAQEDEAPTIDQIMEEQGRALFNALHSFANGQVHNTLYERLIGDKTILNAGNVDGGIADTSARINGIVENLAQAHAQREELNFSHFGGDGSDGNFQTPITVEIKSLDELFTLFNQNSEGFQQEVLKQITEATEEQRDAVAKLHAALSHFADKNGNKKLSEDQIEMLKNNGAFMRFMGWVCSLLPEFLQVGPIANCTNRYYVSRSEKELLIM